MNANELLKLYTPKLPSAYSKFMSEYEPREHNVMKPSHRPDKDIYEPVMDANGDEMLDDEGNVIMQKKIVPVNRVAIPMQKSIVSLRKYFMNLRNAQVVCDNEDSLLLQAVKDVRNKNKYNFKIEEIATRTMSELQGAELWYIPKESSEIRMQVLSPKKGDVMLPIFDEYGDMKYFIRAYKITDINTQDVVDMTDVFTKEENFTFRADGTLINTWKNESGKMPIIYYSQDLPEWQDVQVIIERFETLVSNFGDTNEYNGAPIVVAKGGISGFSSKGERGKVLEVESDADVSYLSWDSAPESIKLELDTLYKLMHSFSHTPDISMEALKGQGLSGVAFDRIFIDAKLTANDKLSGSFGESMQRSVNLVSAMCRSLNKSLKDEYLTLEVEPYAFDDVNDFVKNMTQLDGLMSKEAINRMLSNKFGLDESKEWERFKLESDMLSVESAEV